MINLALILLLMGLSAVAQNPIFFGSNETEFTRGLRSNEAVAVRTSQLEVSTISLTTNGDLIPDGVTFWDDFNRSNTKPGTLTPSPAINPLTGTNYVWRVNPAFSAFSNYYITNGFYTATDGATATNNGGAHPQVDLGFKPTYFGARLKRVNTGIVGASQYPQFIFVVSPNSNNINSAFHFGIIPGVGCNIGFWLGTLTNIFSGQTTNWVNQVSGQEFTFQCWIDGTNATFDLGGSTATFKDARFKTFGGRFLDAEIYINAGAGGRVYDLQVLSIWAGVSNQVPSLTLTLGSNTVSLAWSALTSGLVLQKADVLQSNAWTSVTSATNTVNGTNTVTESLAASKRFYRLFKP